MLGNGNWRRFTISEILTIPSSVVCNDNGLIFNLEISFLLLSNFFQLIRHWCQPLQLQEVDQTPLRWDLPLSLMNTSDTWEWRLATWFCRFVWRRKNKMEICFIILQICVRLHISAGLYLNWLRDTSPSPSMSKALMFSNNCSIWR